MYADIGNMAPVADVVLDWVFIIMKSFNPINHGSDKKEFNRCLKI
jgi:hypothetical protein